MNAGLLGLAGVQYGQFWPKGLLAAKNVGPNYLFVTNKVGIPGRNFVGVLVIPGTGVVFATPAMPILNGPNGKFPWGYEVVPDRPRIWSV